MKEAIFKFVVTICLLSGLYGTRLGFANFDDKILSPDSCVERDPICMAASEREHGCQGAKDVEKKSQNLSGRRINANPRDLYIDLMKRCVTNTIYEDPGIDNPYDPSTRENGLDWPKTAHSMIGIKRLDNIHFCLKEILENGIPGDCIETGVWRGGATIFMRAILKAYGDETRKVWVADSFEGLPPSNLIKYPADKDLNLNLIKDLAVPLEEVQSNFKKYNLLDTQVIFLKGLFKDTLPIAPIEKLALLRLDGDLYESTMDALTHLYPKLSVGGFLIVDDYSIEACLKAVHDYRAMHGITDPIIPIDINGVYWKKSHPIP